MNKIQKKLAERFEEDFLNGVFFDMPDAKLNPITRQIGFFKSETLKCGACNSIVEPGWQDFYSCSKCGCLTKDVTWEENPRPC